MIAISVQSGSNGNCIYVEAGGAKLLFDAGISGLQAQRRLEKHGRDIHKVDMVIISHDHSDHVRCAGVYHRKFGLPVYMTKATHETVRRQNLGKVEVTHFVSGQNIQIRDAVIETFRTPHDAADGVVFVVRDGKHSLGVLTDLGHVFAELPDIIADLDAVFIESNYDPDMLANGPYPFYLQQRISGMHGHLSNFEAADLLKTAASPKIRWACLSHLSENNNTPALAMETHRGCLSKSFPLHIASRHDAGEILTL